MVHYDAGILEGDEGEKEPDSRGNSEFERFGDRVDDPCAHRQQAQHDKQYARSKHGAQCDLPAVIHTEHDAIRKERVESHSRCEGNRVIGIEAHDESANGCRHTRGDEGSTEVQPCIRQDGRIDERDIGHGQKGCEAGKDFRAYSRAVLRQPEERREHCCSP